MAGDEIDEIAELRAVVVKVVRLAESDSTEGIQLFYDEVERMKQLCTPRTMLALFVRITELERAAKHD